MNPEAIANATTTVIASLGTLIGIVSRPKRRRNHIRENLSLAEELEKNALLRDHTPTIAWINTKIALDVAKLSGQSLETPKKPIPWGSVILSSIAVVGFGYWSYWLNSEEFVWYSTFPGVVAFLMAMSVYGSFLNREILPEENSQLPDSAVPVHPGQASEQISSALSLAAAGADEMYEEGGQLGVAFQFIARMAAGEFNDAVDLTDENWLLCRIQSWVWNIRVRIGEESDSLEGLADAMLQNKGDHILWEEFTESEVAGFQEAWNHLNLERLGGASRRRRVARDYDLVVLAPVGASGGYYVDSATIVPGALTFLMRRHQGRWLLASHLAMAPPTPGFPPAWWVLDDPSIDALED
ncbi:hypothetical protein [Streptomyces sp. NBC_01465]|uniref:hypothetical protein n=1 Tax=Streptomyces sp. NBC_01465 TaxID=2903878 RepID=UPI002E2F8BDC|nr:hypothetical protein [Streptomyces sp. NBC_01465]